MKKKIWTAVSLICALLFIASLGTRFWAATEVNNYLGPDHIAVDENNIYVHVNKIILQLDYAGNVISEYPPEMTGIDDAPIDMRVIGRNRLLVALQRPARMLLCDLLQARCKPYAQKLAGSMKSQYKVWWAQEVNALFAVDFGSDSMYAYDIEYDAVRRVPLDRPLNGPNDFLLTSMRHFWIADTLARQISEYVPSKDGGLARNRVLKASNRHSRKLYTKPMLLAQDRFGRIWATQTGLKGNVFDVLVYDRDKGAVQRIDFPAAIFAADIASLGDRMIVTDMQNYRMYQVDVDSFLPSRFGAESFQRYMRQSHEQHQWLEKISTYTLAGTVVFAMLMIGAAVLATPKKERWSEAATTTVNPQLQQDMPALKGLRWLKRDPKTEKKLKMMWPMFLLCIGILLLTAASFFVLPDLKKAGQEMIKDDPKVVDMFAFFVVFLVVISGTVFFAVRSMKRQLGTDGNLIYVKLNNGRELSFEPGEVVFTKRHLVHDRTIVTLCAGSGEFIYNKDEMAAYLDPLLTKATRVNYFSMLYYLLTHREISTVYNTIVFIVLLVWGLTAGIFTELVQAKFGS